MTLDADIDTGPDPLAAKHRRAGGQYRRHVLAHRL